MGWDGVCMAVWIVCRICTVLGEPLLVIYLLFSGCGGLFAAFERGLLFMCFDCVTEQ